MKHHWHRSTLTAPVEQCFRCSCLRAPVRGVVARLHEAVGLPAGKWQYSQDGQTWSNAKPKCKPNEKGGEK
jgi:hypothetical protein